MSDLQRVPQLDRAPPSEVASQHPGSGSSAREVPDLQGVPWLDRALQSKVTSHHLGAGSSTRYAEGTRVNDCPGHSLTGFLLHEGAGQLYSCLGTYPEGERLTCRESHG